ncbi:MAG: glutathione S-transferase family protein [Parvularculales bacterium]
MPLLVLTLIFGRLEMARPFFIRPLSRMIARQVTSSYIGPCLAGILGFMEQTLARTPWFAGDEFTAADIQMGYPVEAGAMRGDLIAQYPHVKNFLSRTKEHPAYQATVGKGGGLKPFG